MHRIYYSASLQSCFRVARPSTSRIISRTIATETQADTSDIPNPQPNSSPSTSSTSFDSSLSSSSRPKETPGENYKKTSIEYPYFVPRNSKGSVPVYSDIRNNHTKHLTLIRNVEGSVLVSVLFPLLVSSCWPFTGDIIDYYSLSREKLEFFY